MSATAATAVRHTGGSAFYAAMSVVLLVAVIAGFWPQYYGPLLSGTPLAPHLRHWGFAAHSAMSLGWMAVFVIQSFLVWRAKTSLHRKLGPYFAAFGILVIAVDAYAAISIEALRVEMTGALERAAQAIFWVTRDLIMFGAYLGAAIAYRKQPQLHKRLIFLATYSLAIIGVARLVGRWTMPEHIVIFAIICSTPILSAIAYDWFRQRRVHSILVVGLALSLLQNFSGGFGLSRFWQPAGKAILAPFLG